MALIVCLYMYNIIHTIHAVAMDKKNAQMYII